MKTDLRVRYTREVIQRAFLELLKEKPLNRITVKEVCDRAEINRGTFYKHYLDCYDLMDKIEEQAIARFDEVLASAKDVGEEQTLLVVLRAVMDNRELVERLAARPDREHFTRRLAEHYFEHMAQHDTIASAFLAGGCAGVIEYWISTGMAEPPERIAAGIVKLANILRQGLDKK